MLISFCVLSRCFNKEHTFISSVCNHFLTFNVYKQINSVSYEFCWKVKLLDSVTFLVCVVLHFVATKMKRFSDFMLETYDYECVCVDEQAFIAHYICHAFLKKSRGIKRKLKWTSFHSHKFHLHNFYIPKRTFIHSVILNVFSYSFNEMSKNFMPKILFAGSI